ncbi:MAG: flavin reductase, partial [Nitratireductor sp.]|nr:flavin reductase [Nitratireductor sp.]
MARFAGAVNIVTTAGHSGRRGVTVSAAVSVSDNPPTILVCLNRNRAENAFFAENGVMALNTLCEGHVSLARAFAGEG